MKSGIYKPISTIISILVLSGCGLTPSKVDDKTQLENTQGGIDKFIASSDTINHQISLSEAIARTIKYNLDYRLQHTQLMLENGNLKMAYIEMLPTLTGDLNYSFRNNPQIQNLVNADGQVVDGDTSYTPREILDVSAGMQWTVLDLGLSFTRAQQQANRVMIMQEERRKITQQLVQQAISVYWKAWTAQNMHQTVIDFKEKVRIALKKSQNALDIKASPTPTELDYQSVLLKSIRRANKLQLEISSAKAELTRLMNIRPGAEFELASPNKTITKLPNIQPQLAKMDLIAMVNRPELRQSSHQIDIAKKGIQAAVIEMLPGLSFDFGYNYTNNRFMLNQEWMGGNLGATIDLFNMVLRGPFAIDMANQQVDFEKIKTAATTLSVLTQIRVAYTNYLIWKEDYQYAKLQDETTSKLLKNALANERANKGNSQISIRRGIESLNATFDRQVTFARAYEALAKLYQSVGIDLLPHEVRYLSLEEITERVQVVLNAQSTGEFNQVIDSTYTQLLPQLKQYQQDKIDD
jgi:outer membrane protein TolC